MWRVFQVDVINEDVAFEKCHRKHQLKLCEPEDLWEFFFYLFCQFLEVWAQMRWLKFFWESRNLFLETFEGWRFQGLFPLSIKLHIWLPLILWIQTEKWKVIASQVLMQSWFLNSPVAWCLWDKTRDAVPFSSTYSFLSYIWRRC